MPGTPGGTDMLSWEFAQNPYETFGKLEQEAGATRQVVKTFSSELNAWVVTGYENVRTLLADPRLAKNGPGLAAVAEAQRVTAGGGGGDTTLMLSNMLFTDPPDHTRLRAIVGRSFTMRRVEEMRPWIEATAETILDTIVPGEPFDLVDKVALALPIYVIGNLLGIPERDFDRFRTWSAQLSAVDIDPADKQRSLGVALTYLQQLAADKAVTPGEDMISALVTQDGDEAPCTPGEVMSTIFLMMTAGYETTANLISSGVYALLSHPDQQHRLRAEPALIPAALEEFLRFESPLSLTTARYTTAPVPVGSVTIPANEMVFLALTAANRDAARFDLPGELDVTRSDSRAHLAFGRGVHHCVGAPLARLEGEIVFRRLLNRFSRWEAATPLSELTWRHSAQIRALNSLPVRLS